MTIKINLQNPLDLNAPSKEDFEKWVNKAFDLTDLKGEITIRIVDETESQRLNHTYRGKDKPTNILTFAYDDEDMPLGDLVICASVMDKEAREQKTLLNAHYAHIVIHGCLHLLGFEHQDDQEALDMENRETELLKELGYDNPYV